MKTADTPKISRAPAFPLIWLVPLLAVAVAGWMGFRELRERGPEITIDFKDGTGVEAGKTVLEHKGVSVGMVKAVRLKHDLSGVSVVLRIDKDAAELASSDSQFWIVHPEIGFSGVHGLDTLLTGSRLNVRPGKGAPAQQFTGLDKTPPPEISDKGRTFVLQGDRLGSLTTGAPVFFREFKVGTVQTTWLGGDSTGVLIRIHIDTPYVDLVRTSTRFWNAGGFDFKVSLLGAELKDTSLESLVAGGVSFATPDVEPLAPPAPDGTQFKLASQAEKEWQSWAPKIPVKSPESISELSAKIETVPAIVKP